MHNRPSGDRLPNRTPEIIIERELTKKARQPDFVHCSAMPTEEVAKRYDT